MVATAAEPHVVLSMHSGLLFGQYAVRLGVLNAQNPVNEVVLCTYMVMLFGAIGAKPRNK